LNGLIIPISNNLEKLKGDLKDHYIKHIKNQGRINFLEANGHLCNAEIIDYHNKRRIRGNKEV
jgi:plasmid maintenance system killer protein